MRFGDAGFLRFFLSSRSSLKGGRSLGGEGRGGGWRGREELGGRLLLSTHCMVAPSFSILASVSPILLMRILYRICTILRSGVILSRIRILTTLRILTLLRSLLRRDLRDGASFTLGTSSFGNGGPVADMESHSRGARTVPPFEGTLTSSRLGKLSPDLDEKY